MRILGCFTLAIAMMGFACGLTFQPTEVGTMAVSAVAALGWVFCAFQAVVASSRRAYVRSLHQQLDGFRRENLSLKYGTRDPARPLRGVKLPKSMGHVNGTVRGSAS